MTQLVAMRGRIRAVETIEKITHAMRLIAMSTHTQNKGTFKNTRIYTGALKNIAMRLQNMLGPEEFASLLPLATSGNTCIIVVGSQKGLCGNFNTLLFSFFSEKAKELDLEEKNTRYVAVGAKAVDLLSTYTKQEILALSKFSSLTLETVCHTLFELIYAKPHFKNIILFSNENVSFFSRLPRMHTMRELLTMDVGTAIPQDFTWHEDPKKIADTLVQSYVHAILRLYLLESLVAESAARFVSMDSATRNAQQILEESRLAYNKLRQAKITKELGELAATLT